MGWVVFRAENLSAFGTYTVSMFANPVLTDDMFWGYFTDKAVIFVFAILFSMPVAPMANRIFAKNLALKKIQGFVYPFVVFALFLVSAAYIVKGSYNPFIYFNF